MKQVTATFELKQIDKVWHDRRYKNGVRSSRPVWMVVAVLSTGDDFAMTMGYSTKEEAQLALDSILAKRGLREEVMQPLEGSK